MKSYKKMFSENKYAILDAFVLGGAALISIAASLYFDFAEMFFEFSRKHEDWELDDFFFSIALISSFYMMIFALRRWRETSLLLRKAYTDSLTDAYNRRKCMSSLKTEIQIFKKFNKPLSITALDLDHFKKINDIYGHAAGDYVLKTMSGLAKNEMRSADTLFRIGGEEFLIISKDTDLIGASRLAERLRSMIEKYPFKKIGSVTASFGVASCQIGDSIETLMERADKKLYEAKESGRNMVVY